MNTIYLKEFTVLAETKNYWEASERLFINQSTLSKHIKALETDLDVPLFTRTTRRVELTGYGEVLLPYAQNIVKQEFEYNTLLIQLKNAEKGVITIGTIPSMAQNNITNVLLDFVKRYPQCKSVITEADANDLKDILLSKRCELIFLRESKLAFEQHFIHDDGIERIPYIQDYLVAVLPKNHPLAGREALHLRDLKTEKFCMVKEGTFMYELCTTACQSAGFFPDIIFSSHHIDSILDMVTNGNCIALLMSKHVEYPNESIVAQDPPFAVIPITPKITSQISLCYLKNAKLSAMADNFVRYCQDAFLRKEK